MKFTTPIFIVASIVVGSPTTAETEVLDRRILCNPTCVSPLVCCAGKCVAQTIPPSAC
ncbi:hypothetical protein BJ165DRAFT_1439828 [Panaeolus papilionaceus]|nr:hypothetical protein BJ165DRAFT_1439828 [Panaeolus papilionaceus]